jgi:hypothetical protein
VGVTKLSFALSRWSLARLRGDGCPNFEAPKRLKRSRIVHKAGSAEKLSSPLKHPIPAKLLIQRQK